MRLFKENRVALVCNSLEAYAGVERRTLELAYHLRDRGREVEIVALRTTGKVADLYREAGFSVHFIPVYRYTDRIVFSPLKLLRLAVFFLRRRYGVIVGIQPPSHYFARLAGFPPLNRRLFAMERLSLEQRGRRFRTADRLLQNWTTRIICVGSLMRDQLIQNCSVSPHKVLVVNNGVSLDNDSTPEPSYYRLLKDSFVFGFVGLLEQRKRPDLILGAFIRIVATNPESKLFFVGDGPLRERLVESVTAENLSEKVFFVGEQLNPHKFYPLFDAFVFPSVLEGFGTVWAEAMTHGIPVICADIRPMNDYVRHEVNGLLATPNDIDSLEGQMRQLLSDYTLRKRLGEAGRAYALENFDKRAQLEKLETVFWPDN